MFSPNSICPFVWKVLPTDFEQKKMEDRRDNKHLGQSLASIWHNDKRQRQDLSFTYAPIRCKFLLCDCPFHVVYCLANFIQMQANLWDLARWKPLKFKIVGSGRKTVSWSTGGGYPHVCLIVQVLKVKFSAKCIIINKEIFYRVTSAESSKFLPLHLI